MKKLAIIGSGIAGMGCAYFLDNQYDITIFEKNNYIGGHTNTIEVKQGEKAVPVDTGFMVFNKVTYPNLLQFFNHLEVAYQETDMSFSVHDAISQTEWNGAGLDKIFSQRSNLFKPTFWSFLSEMKQFCEEAPVVVNSEAYTNTSIKDFLISKKYSEHFSNWFLIPMGSAIWSTSTDRMLDFPIQTLLRFFLNHGFLGLDTHYQWYTVSRGSQQYVKKLREKLKATFKPLHVVNKIVRNPSGAEVHCNNQVHHFDKVILASHANQSLSLLEVPTELEQEILSCFTYEKNTAVLHSDDSVMPKRKRCWAAWNYHLSESGQHKKKATVHYWMNRLQSIANDKYYFVSLNTQDTINPDKIYKTIDYEHPVFDLKAIEAQKRIHELNHQDIEQPVYFCGSYFKYGFHEDAFISALDLSKQLGGSIPWTSS